MHSVKRPLAGGGIGGGGSGGSTANKGQRTTNSTVTAADPQNFPHLYAALVAHGNSTHADSTAAAYALLNATINANAAAAAAAAAAAVNGSSGDGRVPPPSTHPLANAALDISNMDLGLLTAAATGTQSHMQVGTAAQVLAQKRLLPAPGSQLNGNNNNGPQLPPPNNAAAAAAAASMMAGSGSMGGGGNGLKNVDMSHGMGQHHLPTDERRRKRLERNRVAAKECRLKKKRYMGELEDLVSQLKRENAELRDENARLRQLFGISLVEEGYLLTEIGVCQVQVLHDHRHHHSLQQQQQQQQQTQQTQQSQLSPTEQQHRQLLQQTLSHTHAADLHALSAQLQLGHVSPTSNEDMNGVIMDDEDELEDDPGEAEDFMRHHELERTH